MEELIEMMVNVLHARKDLRFLRQGKPQPVDAVSTIVTWETATHFLFDPVALNAKLIPLPVSEVSASHLLDLENLSANQQLFAPGASVGSPSSSLFWVAPKMHVDQLRKECNSTNSSLADRLRDILGLPHHQPGEVLLELYCPGSIMGNAVFAAPTFIEAASHSRFKARPDCEAADNWGRTADLALVWPPGANSGKVDGLPEAVVARSRFHQDMGWKWSAVGIVKGLSEGRTSSTDRTENDLRDEHFATLLCQGLDLAEVIKQLQTLMEQYAVSKDA
ncbi:MAG: hypothetical protein HQM04_03235 [Magnetococcales bacterium]|nr:hypothetical protein [Magnetococcales bacterium]MBF0114036.1 hypothetical protein [Magnetococcales bacterium]